MLTAQTKAPIILPFPSHPFPAVLKCYNLQQYMFGDHILACPVSQMVKFAAYISIAVWLPPDVEWTWWDGRGVIEGGWQQTTWYDVTEIPLFVRAGTMLSLKTHEMASMASTSPPLTWTVWPGGSNGSYTVYEDDGESRNYGSVFATTTASYVVSTDVRDPTTTVFTLTVAPALGSYPGMPPSRWHRLQLRGLANFTGSSIKSVTVNGVGVGRVGGSNASRPLSWWVNDAYSLTAPLDAVIVDAGVVPMSQQLQIVVTAGGTPPLPSGSDHHFLAAGVAWLAVLLSALLAIWRSDDL